MMEMGRGQGVAGDEGVCVCVSVYELGLAWPEHGASEELAPGVLFTSLTAGCSKTHFLSPALVSS